MSMGQMITFPSNGSEGQGYLAIPPSGSGPGVVIIQEWWGLNDQLREVCDVWAADGFTVLAPDLYRGVATTEPDEAGKLMMSLNIEQAAKDMVGAVDFLSAHDAVVGEHAFTNHHRPEVYNPDATALAFERAKAFLRATLSGSSLS